MKRKKEVKTVKATKKVVPKKSQLMFDPMPSTTEEQLALCTPEEIAAIRELCEAARATDYALRTIDVPPERLHVFEGLARAGIVSLGQKDNGNYGATLADFYACHAAMRL